jgi:hypothetical protein
LVDLTFATLAGADEAATFAAGVFCDGATLLALALLRLRGLRFFLAGAVEVVAGAATVGLNTGLAGSTYVVAVAGSILYGAVDGVTSLDPKPNNVLMNEIIVNLLVFYLLLGFHCKYKCGF